MIDNKFLYDTLTEIEERIDTMVKEIFKDPQADDYLWHKGYAEGLISAIKAMIATESIKEAQAND